MNCTCGAQLRQFWIWRDANGSLHASHFRPTTGLERSVMASTARDALLPMSAAGTPRHDVVDESGVGIAWHGRCSATARLAASAPDSRQLEPVTAR